MIVKKTPAEIDKMAAAGAIHARTMHLVEGKIREGITTRELDEIAEKYIRSQGAVPSFKGYRGFPGLDLRLAELDGRPRHPGQLPAARRGHPVRRHRRDAGRLGRRRRLHLRGRRHQPVARKLLDVTEASLLDAVEQARPGNRIGDISWAVQSRVEAEGMSVVRSLVGHGVGREMHEDPQVPNFGQPGRGPLLEEGMVIAIEPMVNAGRHMVRMDDDGWAIFSQDGSLAAHFEFTVAVTADGPRILTPWHELRAVAA